MKKEVKNILWMELLEVSHKSCIAHFWFDDKEKWITLYDIKSKNEWKWEAQELLQEIKSDYKDYIFWWTVALSPAMKHIYNKLNIIEYEY